MDFESLQLEFVKVPVVVTRLYKGDAYALCVFNHLFNKFGKHDEFYHSLAELDELAVSRRDIDRLIKRYPNLLSRRAAHHPLLKPQKTMFWRFNQKAFMESLELPTIPENPDCTLPKCANEHLYNISRNIKTNITPENKGTTEPEFQLVSPGEGVESRKRRSKKQESKSKVAMPWGESNKRNAEFFAFIVEYIASGEYVYGWKGMYPGETPGWFKTCFAGILKTVKALEAGKVTPAGQKLLDAWEARRIDAEAEKRQEEAQKAQEAQRTAEMMRIPANMRKRLVEAARPLLEKQCASIDDGDYIGNEWHVHITTGETVKKIPIEKLAEVMATRIDWDYVDPSGVYAEYYISLRQAKQAA